MVVRDVVQDVVIGSEKYFKNTRKYQKICLKRKALQYFFSN